jgi:hypothetical protein
VAYRKRTNELKTESKPRKYTPARGGSINRRRVYRAEIGIPKQDIWCGRLRNSQGNQFSIQEEPVDGERQRHWKH